MPPYHIDNNLSQALNIDGNLNWFVLKHLCEPVDNVKYQVIVVSFLIR